MTADSTTTTSYGTWANVYGGPITIKDEIDEALDDCVDEYAASDVIALAYENAINQALPPGADLIGDEFYGPAFPEPGEFDAYPCDSDGELDLVTIVQSVDLWKVIDQHALTS